MNLPRLAISNTQFTIIIVTLLALLGLVSYKLMPRSEDPQFDLPITLVDVIYPGASPKDIEALVINPIEREIAKIENILKVESQIMNGSSRTNIEFIYGVDADVSFNKVKQAIATIKPQLPEGVQQLLVLKATPISVAIMQLALWSEPHNYKDAEFYSIQLKKRIEAIPGVRRAEIWGNPQQIVAIDVNLALLNHYALSIETLSQILAGRAKNITPGFVDANTRRFNVKASGSFHELTDLENTVIQSNSGAILKLKDVAQVSFSNITPNYLAYFNEKPVTFLTVQQRPNTNIFSLTEEINKEIKSFTETLPSSIKLRSIFQQADSVNIRVDGFFNNLWQGLAIIGVMALLFLGVREAAVVIAAVPLSFLIAIGWLDIAGFGLQQMSIVGLIIALGLLVDNAIVVTESIHREKNSSGSMFNAAANGTSRVGWAITSGTVTTMLAFLPMLLIASNTGDFVRSMPVTVVLVLLASLLIALTLTPLLAAKLFSVKEPKIKSLQVYVNAFSEKVYAPLVAKLIRFKWAVIAVSIAVMLALFSLFSTVGVSLFPKAEKPMLLVNVEAPVNSTLQHTDSVMQQVASTLKKYELVKEIAINVGNSNPRIYYNEIPKRGIAHYGQILLVLDHYDNQEVKELVDNIRSKFLNWPLAKIEVKEFTQGPVTDQPITIRVMSESLDDLSKVANDIARKMRKTEGIINIDNPIGEPNTELSLNIDYQKAALLNIDIATLDKTVSSVLNGNNLGLFNDTNGLSYPIILRNKNRNIEQLNEVYINNRLGEQIPLSELVTPTLFKGQTNFFHYQKLRMAKVSANVSSDYLVAERTKKLQEYLEHYEMPKGTYISMGGEEESRKKSFAGLFQIMIVTAIGIFAVLVLQFKSLLQPLIIFSSIPFAIAGAILGLYLTGLSFSMMAFIGLISLFGIVVNNAIILIDTVNRKVANKVSVVDAVLFASKIRFTPILLTTLTTIGGLIPLTMFGGDLWQPLGVVLISGLCVSAVSSFLFVPVLVTLFTRQEKSS